jgi:hypothetical protein
MSARVPLKMALLMGKVSAEDADGVIDEYRTEVLAKAIGRLRAIPVDCTALTGPVWYGDGWNSAITCLEEIADYQTPDDEAYPGELQRLRALALGLRVAALRKEDLAEAQRLLVVHAKHEMDVREKATTEAATATPFYQPGYTYSRDGGWKFRVDTITTHPENGRRTALGWRHFRDEWEPCGYDEDDWEIHEFDGPATVTATEAGGK